MTGHTTWIAALTAATLLGLTTRSDAQVYIEPNSGTVSTAGYSYSPATGLTYTTPATGVTAYGPYPGTGYVMPTTLYSYGSTGYTYPTYTGITTYPSSGYANNGMNGSSYYPTYTGYGSPYSGTTITYYSTVRRFRR